MSTLRVVWDLIVDFSFFIYVLDSWYHVIIDNANQSSIVSDVRFELTFSYVRGRRIAKLSQSLSLLLFGYIKSPDSFSGFEACCFVSIYTYTISLDNLAGYVKPGWLALIP